MATVTKPIALDESFNTTEQTPRNIADVLAEGLSHITGRTASEVEYDNSESGLTSDDVQGAIDELSERPTLPTTDIQTAVDEFETYNGGLLSECKVALSPIQDLHGYDYPWVGGAGKNKINCNAPTVTKNGVTVTNNGDGTFTATGTITAQTDFFLTNGGSADLIPLGDITDGYLINGCPNGGGTSSYQLIIGSLNSRYATDSGNGDTLTNTLQVGIRVILRVFSNYSFPTGGLTFKPMIRASGASADFEPYSNICPISGHTQVEVDVSDGQTTQEQVTVNLGGTYYSGTLDVVTGVFVPDTAKTTINDCISNRTTSYDHPVFYGTISGLKNGNPIMYSDKLRIIEGKTSASDFASNSENGDFTNNSYNTGASIQVFLRMDDYSDVPSLKSAIGDAEIVYELATPTPIQLSPTMVKALVGENHLSAPLDGQEITESEYRELFTWDEVESYVNAHIGGGSGMNYSTNEQVIGTWIDSKPLYQKTITHSGALTVDNTFSNDIGTLANVDQFVKCEGYFRRTDANGLMYSLNGGTRPEDGADSYKVTTRFFNGQVQVAVKGYIDIEYIALTVQYTKTTD